MMTSSKKSRDLGYHFDFFRGTYGAWTSTSPENWGVPPLPPEVMQQTQIVKWREG